MGIGSDIANKTKNLKTPKISNRGCQVVLGLVNCFFFGIGTILGGISDDCDGADIVIGLLQLFLPFVGWIWSIIWGILMILDK